GRDLSRPSWVLLGALSIEQRRAESVTLTLTPTSRFFTSFRMTIRLLLVTPLIPRQDFCPCTPITFHVSRFTYTCKTLPRSYAPASPPAPSSPGEGRAGIWGL